jgi:zinc protease
VYAYQESKALMGSFICYVATSPENEPKARQMALATIADLKKTKLTNDELNAAKNYSIGSFEISLQANSSLADLLTRWELIGRGYEAVDLYPERIKKVSAETIAEIADKYFSAKHFGLGMIEGKKSPLSGK